MHRFTLPDIRTTVRLALIEIMIVLLLILEHTTQGADDTIVRTALAAWRARQESTTCFLYRCDLEKSFLKNEVPPSGDAFSPPRQGTLEAVLLRTKIMFAVSGDTFAYSKEGDDWDLGRGTMGRASVKKVYDGACEKYLFDGGPFPMGHVDSGGWARNMILADCELTPFCFPSHTVLILKALAYEPARMTMSEPHAFCNGHDCVKFSVPKTASSICHVYADPSRDYLPLEYADLRNGVVLFRSSLAYVPDQADRWRISEIRSTAFDDTGVAKTSWTYNVVDYSINTPLDKELFTLEFPEGAHVVEGANLIAPANDTDIVKWKYYIVGRNHTTTPISPDEYGRIHTDRTMHRLDSSEQGASNNATRRVFPLLAGLIVLATTVVVVLWRRRNKAQ